MVPRGAPVLSAERPDLLIVTPAYHGGATGAAVYYGLLTEAFAADGRSVHVVGDRRQAPSPVHYHALFPERVGRDRRPVRDRIAYAAQNLTYLALPGIVRRVRPRALLVHTSFYNFPGIFPAVAGRLATLCREAGIRLMADARDRLLPAGRVGHLNRFAGVICCSGNVEAHLVANGLASDRVVPIPVPQEPVSVDPAVTAELLSGLGLEDVPYILYAGLVKEAKGVDLLLEAYERHVRPAAPDCQLVLAGYLKARRSSTLRALEQPGVALLGNRSRQEVMHLMAGAALCVNLSPSEGLPRGSLEALALGRPSLLPPGVPEFERYCPEHVARSRDPEVLGARMLELLAGCEILRYPIERHSLERIYPMYLDALELS